jgi:hypothetical protein
MNRLCFTFGEEPTGQVYYDLIDFALTTQKCKYAFLVGSSRTALHESGRQALASLYPFLIEAVEVSEWPGTKLLGNRKVQLYKYNFGLDFANQLKVLSYRLYQWQHPDLPEDLSFMINDKLPWLFTIAHERDAVLCLEPDELEEIRRLPFLATLLIEDKSYRENAEL